MVVNVVAEDQLSMFVIKSIFNKILTASNVNVIEISGRGKGNIKNNLQSYNKASAKCIFYILVDLDNEECAPFLVSKWVRFKKNEGFIFRIAVREIESWILADTEGLAKYLKITEQTIKKVIQNPDDIDNPKETLLGLVDKCKNKSLQEDLLYKADGAYRQGPAYNTNLCRFIDTFWNMDKAAQNSDSLKRAIHAVATLKNRQ